jgi:predicted nuclease of restriction endonuclease-like (RecB) superfamily
VNSKQSKPKASAKAKAPVTVRQTPAPAKPEKTTLPADYANIHVSIVDLLQAARAQAARSVNALMTASYWEVGRRIVEAEQKGKRRAGYGEQLIMRLSADLTQQFGRGFSERNLNQMRLFYMTWPLRTIFQTAPEKSLAQTIPQTVSAESPIRQTASDKLRTLPAISAPAQRLAAVAACFPLPWSAYVRLLSVKNDHARAFYEAEALRSGWSVRQLDRQIGSQFYERTALSRNKAAMLTKGAVAKQEDTVTPDEAVKDPYVLEFLNLKDEYSETQLEDALIHRLEDFLLELGSDFTFVGRQRRLRIDQTWFRVDLLFFHRRLRCLVIIDLKLSALTHADVGQMHMYCNYARENWTLPGENPPVGLILCAEKGHALARYALEGLPNKIMAAEYQTVLPSVERITQELTETTRLLEGRKGVKPTQRKKAAKGGA